MNQGFKKNLFFSLFAILAVANIFLFSDNINKKKEMAELETQIQSLREGRQEKEKTDVDVAELEAEIQNLETVIQNMREQSVQEKQENEEKEQQKQQERNLRMESLQKLEGQEVSEKWETLAYGKYIRLVQKEEADQKWMSSRLLEENGMRDVDGGELKAVCPVRVGESEGEIYLFHYFADDADVTDAGNYCAIWINRQTNGSEILFHTEGSHADTSLYEFYDMQVCDVDGNGEEDVILLLGAHRSAGAEYYLPDLYCMVAQQKMGKFQCISHEEEWLKEVLHPLYSQQNENRKIANIIGGIKAHYGKKEIEATVGEDTALEEFIAVNDEIILKKLDGRSLFFERELLWETYDLDENNHVQGIKVYKEKGENGMPLTQVAVYLFDYTTEEVEKLEVPEVYQEITDQGKTIEDVELKEIEVKEINGVKNICMKVEIVLATERLPYELNLAPLVRDTQMGWQEEQSNMLMSEEEFDRITKCLDEQVPEIGNEWSDYVKDVSEGGAYLYERMAGYSPEDVYRDYEKTEYLGKYYLVYVGEMWEDHSVNWEYFYVSENFDEVLWYDHIAQLDNEYPVLYLDEWRNSDFYPVLDK